MADFGKILKRIQLFKSIIILFLIYSSSYSLFAQGSSGEKAKYESLYIVNMPTAGVIPPNSFAIYSNIFENSGMFFEFNACPFTGFNFGLSYGGTNILGNKDVSWQNLPGLLIRIRIIDESLKFPAILIGFNTQGRGSYIVKSKRFQNLSPGFFLSASKSYTWKLGYLAFHGGINYSLEPLPSERTPNSYAGIEQSIGNRSSLNLEYNATLDEKPGLIMDKRGLLNLSIRYAFTQNMTVEFQFIDLLNYSVEGQRAMRRFGIEYIDSF